MHLSLGHIAHGGVRTRTFFFFSPLGVRCSDWSVAPTQTHKYTHTHCWWQHCKAFLRKTQGQQGGQRRQNDFVSACVSVAQLVCLSTSSRGGTHLYESCSGKQRLPSPRGTPLIKKCWLFPGEDKPAIRHNCQAVRLSACIPRERSNNLPLLYWSHHFVHAFKGWRVAVSFCAISRFKLQGGITAASICSSTRLQSNLWSHFFTIICIWVVGVAGFDETKCIRLTIESRLLWVWVLSF